MSIYNEVSKIDDAEWVRSCGSLRTTVLKEIAGLGNDEVRSLLADYICMSGRLMRKESLQRELMSEAYSLINHPNKSGSKWATYDRQEVDAALALMKSAMKELGFEFKPLGKEV